MQYFLILISMRISSDLLYLFLVLARGKTALAILRALVICMEKFTLKKQESNILKPGYFSPANISHHVNGKHVIEPIRSPSATSSWKVFTCAKL